MSLIIGISGKKQSGKSTLAEYLTYWIETRIRGFDYAISQYNDGSIHVYTPEDDLFSVDDNGVTYTDTPGIHEILDKDWLHDRTVKTYSFADVLKEMCIDVLGLEYEWVFGTDDEKNTLTEYEWDNLPHDIRIRYSKNGSPRHGRMTAREVMQVLGTDVFREMFSQDVWVNACMRKIVKDDPVVALIPDVRFPSEFNGIRKLGGYVIRLSRAPFSEDIHWSETALDDFPFAEYEDMSISIGDDVTIENKNEQALEFIRTLLSHHSSDHFAAITR